MIINTKKYSQPPGIVLDEICSSWILEKPVCSQINIQKNQMKNQLPYRILNQILPSISRGRVLKCPISKSLV